MSWFCVEKMWLCLQAITDSAEMTWLKILLNIVHNVLSTFLVLIVFLFAFDFGLDNCSIECYAYCANSEIRNEEK